MACLTTLFDFKGKRRQIYHTWMAWDLIAQLKRLFIHANVQWVFRRNWGDYFGILPNLDFCVVSPEKNGRISFAKLWLEGGCLRKTWTFGYKDFKASCSWVGWCCCKRSKVEQLTDSELENIRNAATAGPSMIQLRGVLGLVVHLFDSLTSR